MGLERFLPATSFIGLEAFKVANPSIIWNSSETKVDLLRHAYALPIEQEREGKYLAESITLFADRYGGEGISANGGAGRCGNTGDVQVKGIGRTALVGSGTPESHAYGGATLHEGLREAIWSRVIQSATPFGSVAVHGIISTGSTLVRNENAPSSQRTRALIFRSCPLRPAHFMRSIYFRAPQGLALESVRMRNVMQHFPIVLEQIYGPEATSKLGESTDVSPGILALLTRLARQLAAMYGKKIMHGGISPSNITMDGRFLDFGMTSSVSDHGPIITSGRAPHMEDQPNEMFSSMCPLFFYVEKFGRRLKVAPTDELRQQFLSVYHEHRKWYLMRLTGIPPTWLRELPSHLVHDLASHIDAILKIAIGEPFKLLSACPNYTASMPSRFGKCSLGSVFRILSAEKVSASELDNKLNVEIRDELKRVGIIRSYVAVMNYLRATKSIPIDQIESAISRNCERVNRPLEQLYYPNLNATLERESDRGQSLSDTIDRICNEANSILTDSIPDGFPEIK